MSPAPARLRVVQWATGNIGTRSLRAVLGHPALELVGVHVYDDAKAGRDAGELCGDDPTGVVATSDPAVVRALRADCVLYMPRSCDMEEVCGLLASGANVVTTRGEFHRPASLEPAVRRRVEEACAAGGTSIHSTGSSPGFISEAVPLVLSSIQRRLDRVTIDEYADLSRRDSPVLLFELMGFGRDKASFDPGRWSHGAASFGPSLELTAEAWSLPLDSVTATGEVAVARRALEIAAGRLEAGTVAAQRMAVTGWRGDRPFLTFRANWYCTTELEPAWDLRPTGWRVVVDGDAPLDVELRFTVPLERMAETSPGFTANRAVNAVPYVCAAAPGIRTSLDLPQIVPDLR
ncbi:MAG: NAD(P)H-dependent amine dehydrogenase family protein [Acidimicrobiales bacterium]